MKDNKFLKFLLGFVLVLFLAYQIYAALYRPIETQSAVYGEMVEGVNINAVIIRDESLVNFSSSGVLHFNVESGKRIEKNGVIAHVYSGEEQSIAASQIKALNDKIASIEELESYNAITAADLDLLNTRVKEGLNNLKLACAYGNFEQAGENSEELMMILNRRQMVTDAATDFSGQLQSLKAEREKLQAALSSPQGEISAHVSGYFIDTADGYEEILTPADIEKLTPEILDGLKPNDVKNEVVGKLVSDYKWYIAATVSVNDSLAYKTGDTLTIHTNLKANPEISVKVERVNISSVSDRAVIVFSCQEMSSELATLRSGAMTVVNGVYKGLKLPRRALRIVDSKTGVYVLSGMELKFTPVEILYRDEETMICSLTNDSASGLRLYDEVVVKGKNLYDGKIIN
ncbi:MAG: hypothetical protein E7548_01300 [Ruminococcaceae bacterium]|nr:hypothetical protein [Oscillospiraceae bacterium]